MTTNDRPEQDIRNADTRHDEPIESDSERLDDEDIDDPQFQALLSYIEEAAEKFVKERRQARQAAQQDSARQGSADLDESADAEPLPGTDEYDRRNGIPHYEIR